jgi:hypothetical protein
MTTYNDYLVDEMLALGTTMEEKRRQAHDDDGTGPLHYASEQLQGPRDSS